MHAYLVTKVRSKAKCLQTLSKIMHACIACVSNHVAWKLQPQLPDQLRYIFTYEAYVHLCDGFVMELSMIQTHLSGRMLI